jgi:hypothetical protein
MKTLLTRLSILGLLLALASVFVLGQAISGDLVGTVRDSSGAVVPNVSVEVTNLGTDFKRTTQANGIGEYRFVNLPSGHYKVLVSANGMTGGFADIEIQLNKTATANITTQVAGAGTTVEVLGESMTIDTTTAQIGSTFESKAAQDLPSASTGSGVLNLALLNAGVANGGGVGAGSGPSVSGQRPRNNNFTVEGVDNNSKSVTGPLVTIPNDAVDQFTVLQNQFSPEFGHSSGGQFNQTVHSGTNKFHGRLFEYFENRNLNAIDSLVANGQRGNGETPFNPRFDDNRFGGQVGGPIIHDKVFFFTNWQYEPVGRSGSSTSFVAPTAAGYAALNALYPNSANLATLQKYLPAAGSATTTLCSTTFDPAVGCLAANATIPAGAVGFAGPLYANQLTTANSGDWNISSKDQLRVRYIYSKLDASDTAANIPAFYIPTPTRFHVFTLGEYHNFTPTLNNEFRLGFNRFANTTPSGSFAFPGLAMFPNLTFDELNGLQVGPDGNAPQYTIQNTYQGVDNVSWTKGRHNVKFGVEYREYISPQTFTQRVRGDYEYSSLALFAQDGVPDTFAERSAGNAVYYGNQKAVYIYGNDDFHVTRNFTLNVGLRYELTTPPQGNTLQSQNSISSVPGLISFTNPATQKKNFAPRIGFAWSPGTSGNTSIRGGYSLAYDVLYDNLGILSLPPQLQQTCDVGNVQTPACFWSNTGFLANGGLPSVPVAITDPASARGATGSYVPNQQLPYSETWTFGIQHIFARNWTVESRYVGTRGLHLPVQDRINRQPVVNSSNFLPTYLTAPSLATVAGLTTTLDGPGGLLDQVAAGGNYVPVFLANGFTGSVVGFEPYGGSKYNGLQNQLTRNFTNGLQLQAAWTWSHAFDNSTADVFSTYLTPRRSQNGQCFKCDWSTSALDRRHRVTIEAIYDLPFFKNGNWLQKNVLGNWEVAPVYTFESPEYATVQSALDSNFNGDSAGDRVIYNPAGAPGTSTTVNPVLNAAGNTVAYVAVDPNARYITAGSGALANSPRNSLAMPHTNNFDMTALKRINITERQSIELQAHAFNLFNHAQPIPGILNDVVSFGNASSDVRGILIPGSPTFNQPAAVFSSNPRVLQLVLKYNF